MRPFDRLRMLLGVTGGHASFKAAWLAPLLARAGATVDVVLTRAAAECIGAIACKGLTGRPVHTALIAPGHVLDHIALAHPALFVLETGEARREENLPRQSMTPVADEPLDRVEVLLHGR